MVVSIDGFIEGPNRELDWFRDGDSDFERYCDEMVDSVGLALYGRKAYELMASYWPDAEKTPRSAQDLAFARKMNALPKAVVSSTLKQASWNNTRVLGDDIRRSVSELKEQPGKPIVAWAGAGLVSTLSELRLVDEYRLIVHPIVLGRGTPLFAQQLARQSMKLVRTTQLGQSLVVLCYEPVWT